MVNWENVMVDTDSLEPGKFYQIFTNKDNATLTIEKATQDEVNAEVTELRAELDTLKARVTELESTNPTIINNYCGDSNSSVGGYNYIYDIQTQKVVARMYAYNGNVVIEYLVDPEHNEWQEMVRWS